MAGKKLTGVQVQMIKESALPAEYLAKAFGVSKQHITRIKQGKRRTHVPLPPLERFHKKYKVNKKTKCWEWQGNCGRAMFDLNGKTVTAARFIYEQMKGPIPEGKCVCHHCDNMTCVNPDHLFVGSSTDNNRDMHAKGRGIRGENHHWSKLTEDDIEAILRYRKEGLTYLQIGEMYGVTLQAIHNIVHGKTWAWLK